METTTCVGDGAELGQAKRAKTKASTASARIVRALMSTYPSVRERGFRPTVAKLFDGDEDIIELAAQFIPDAYAVYPDIKSIDLIEVVDTNPISVSKGSAIGAFSDAVSDEGWVVSVVCYDIAGNLTSHVAGVYYSSFFAQYAGGRDDATPNAVRMARESQGKPHTFEELKEAMSVIDKIFSQAQQG